VGGERGPRPPWRRASEQPEHPVARWEGAEVGDDVTLEAWLGPRNSVGASYFRLYIVSEEMGRLRDPLLFGMQNSGRYPGFNWVEVIEYRELLPLEDGRTITVPEGVERLVFRRLAELVPPGGHLMAEYDSLSRRMTARALTAGVPPRATPLGAILAAAGCATPIRNWYISEGGREGPRKLQGFRPLDDEHGRRRDGETLASLEVFMQDSAHLEWDMQGRTRLLAQEAIEDLTERLGGSGAANDSAGTPSV
jgi:hypothetical protein